MNVQPNITRLLVSPTQINLPFYFQWLFSENYNEKISEQGHVLYINFDKLKDNYKKKPPQD